jgi:hypothetical protein
VGQPKGLHRVRHISRLEIRLSNSPVVEVEESVLLLKTEPGLVGGVGLHQLGSLVAVVELVGGAVGHPALGEDEDVVVEAEGVAEDSDGAQVDIFAQS